MLAIPSSPTGLAPLRPLCSVEVAQGLSLRAWHSSSRLSASSPHQGALHNTPVMPTSLPLKNSPQDFDHDRAKTDRKSTSRLSPHIHYGACCSACKGLLPLPALLSACAAAAFLRKAGRASGSTRNRLTACSNNHSFMSSKLARDISMRRVYNVAKRPPSLCPCTAGEFSVRHIYCFALPPCPPMFSGCREDQRAPQIHQLVAAHCLLQPTHFCARLCVPAVQGRSVCATSTMCASMPSWSGRGAAAEAPASPTSCARWATESERRWPACQVCCCTAAAWPFCNPHDCMHDLQRLLSSVPVATLHVHRMHFPAVHTPGHPVP